MLLGLAVLVSSIVDQLVPKISSPLIQIALGVIIATLSLQPISINLEPELFLVLFIAPLLFNDAANADRKALWDNRTLILSLAIGLVVAITLVVGFVLHFVVPSVPLAAAFALGAALGPTDPVAVSALSREAKLGTREGSVLKGEALINDASGIVSFQFAIAAAVTGTFSALEATGAFLASFVGGIAFGIVLALVYLLISRAVRGVGLDNITFHVLLELSMPFLVFLSSEVVGVSGILAVVACGIVWALSKETRVSPYRTRLNITVTSVWKVLAFTLNGIVFVLLGMLLPTAMRTAVESPDMATTSLILIILLVAFVIVALRFIWTMAMMRLSKNPITGKRDGINSQSLHKALVMTVGGPKGAITLSVMMSIPFFIDSGSAFPERSLLICIASGVIICTLLLANFALPILAPHEEADDEEERAEFEVTRIEIMRTVLERLINETEGFSNRMAVNQVISTYNQRILRMLDDADIETPGTTKLRVDVINHQEESIFTLANERKIDNYASYLVLRQLEHNKMLLSNDKTVAFRFTLLWWRFRWLLRNLRHTLADLFNISNPQEQLALRKVRIAAEESAIEYLQGMVDSPEYPSEVVARRLISHERSLQALQSVQGSADYEEDETRHEIQRLAMALENDVIQDYYAEGLLTRAQAKDLRDNVSLMILDLEDNI